jgi:hypothetical protein
MHTDIGHFGVNLGQVCALELKKKKQDLSD